MLRMERLPPATERAPRLLILHGLEGSARSHYARGLMWHAHARGWGADVLTFRSCGGEMNELPRSYHAGETGDLALTVERLARESDAPLLLAGISLGGNVLLKWLGEQGARVPAVVRGAATVSVPYDLARSARYIQHGFARVYQAHFLRSLRAKARLKEAAFPGRVPSAARAQRARTLYDFDDCFTAPLHGFADADEYYARSSSLQFLGAIAVPTLLLSARDDPFLPPEALRDVQAVVQSNTAVTLEIVERGGHVGFVGGRWPWRATYYAESRVLDFLDTLTYDSPISPSSIVAVTRGGTT
ncbi:MAG TPA: alpha/beta fold hydrolase [Gemmatimonadaceae bacterium]|nr:alpha/beta fold hydrolase [Gemmatimonadaceae bacterium]